MLFNVKDIDEKFETVARFFAVEDFIIPAPDYMMGPRWTDENRIKNGYELQPDGSWGRLETSMAVYTALKEDVLTLYMQSKKLSQENETLRKKNYELEYGCRVAALQLDKVSKIVDGEDE
jgi:hypothetical protein